MICSSLECTNSLEEVRRGALYCSKECKHRETMRRQRSGDTSRRQEWGRQNESIFGIVPPVGTSAVYGVVFPECGIFKLGFDGKSSNILAKRVQAAERLGFPIANAYLLWCRSGDLRLEVWLHAHLSYEYPWAFPAKTRASEWYNIKGERPRSIAARLDLLCGQASVRERTRYSAGGSMPAVPLNVARKGLQVRA